MSVRKYRVPSELFLKEHFGRWSNAISSENVWFENVMRQHLQHHEYAYMAEFIRRALYETLTENQAYATNPDIENGGWEGVIEVLDKMREAAVEQKNAHTK